MNSPADAAPPPGPSWAKSLGLEASFESVRFLAEAAMLARRLGDVAAFTSIADGLLLLVPRAPLARLLGADAAYLAGRLDEALDRYRSVTRQPGLKRRMLTSALASEGDCLWRLCREAEAVETWRRAAATDPAWGAEAEQCSVRLRLSFDAQRPLARSTPDRAGGAP